MRTSSWSQTNITVVIQLSLKSSIRKSADCADTASSKGWGSTCRGYGRYLSCMWGLFSSMIPMAVEIHGLVLGGKQFFSCVPCATIFGIQHAQFKKGC